MTHLVRRPGGREGSGETERQMMEGGQRRPQGTGGRGFQETGRPQRNEETGVGVSLSPWKRGNIDIETNVKYIITKVLLNTKGRLLNIMS